MQPFTFFKMRGPDDRAYFAIEFFEDVVAARVRAETLVREPGVMAVELWDDATRYYIEPGSRTDVGGDTAVTDRIPIAQRALELAATGEFEKLRDIKRQLKAERYEQIDSHLQGSLGKQVSAAAKVAWQNNSMIADANHQLLRLVS